MHKLHSLSLPLAVLTILTFAQCSKKGDPVAPNPIPTNSAALKVDGVAYPVSIANCSATVDAKTGELRVSIYSGGLTEPYVYFNIVEFKERAETIKFYPVSGSGFYIKGKGRLPDGTMELDFSSQNCQATLERSFEVTEVNQDTKTVSVKFSGNACSGSEVKKITDGQINLHYVVR